MNDHEKGCEFWGANDGRCHAVRADFDRLQSDAGKAFDAEAELGAEQKDAIAELRRCDELLEKAVLAVANLGRDLSDEIEESGAAVTGDLRVVRVVLDRESCDDLRDAVAAWTQATQDTLCAVRRAAHVSLNLGPAVRVSR